MSTTASPPPPPAPEDAAQSQLARRNAQTLHHLALGAVIVCPLLIALPPRKMDIYTCMLVGSTALGANHILRERSGRGIWARVRAMAAPGQDRVGGAEAASTMEVQRQIREANTNKGGVVGTRDGGSAEAGLPEWKRERNRREKEYLEAGKGYGDLIMDQIREVWYGGKDKAGGIKEVNEKVEARKAGSGKK